MGHGHREQSRLARADSARVDERRLGLALVLIVGLLVVEVVAGVAAHSLALLSDAAHMLADAGALGLALIAARLAARPAQGAMTYGLGRTEILSAQFNGAILLVLGLLIGYEGIRRLVGPPGVAGLTVLVVAGVGIAVNLGATAMLAQSKGRSLNVEGAFLHTVSDLAAFIFTAVAGAIILITGFNRADGIASLMVAAIMLAAAYRLLRDSGRVFLEAAPKGLQPNAVAQALLNYPDVREVHDLHVWEVTSGFTALSAHVLVDRQRDCHEIRRVLERMLSKQFAIEHTTLQVDHDAPGRLLDIELPRVRGGR